jgi:hypothetical protein
MKTLRNYKTIAVITTGFFYLSVLFSAHADEQTTLASLLEVQLASTEKFPTTSAGGFKRDNTKNSNVNADIEDKKPLSRGKLAEKFGKTREEVNTLNSSTVDKSAKVAVSNLNDTNRLSRINYDYSFGIYDAASLLILDVDGDGYHQEFSVVFDADLYSYSHIDSADVYAELYLSKNGGPWVHYFTTEDFRIYGENIDDEYEVNTTLHQGYDSNEFDVLIDLYEVGYQGVVATISSQDTSALYALPLESTEYDEIEQITIIESHGHGGSTSSAVIFLLLVCALTRVIKKMDY